MKQAEASNLSKELLLPNTSEHHGPPHLFCFSLSGNWVGEEKPCLREEVQEAARDPRHSFIGAVCSIARFKAEK